MSEKYREAMDKIVVSEELKAKIINNTLSYEKRKKSKPLAISYLRYAVSYAACFALCLYAVSTNEPYIENINKANNMFENADYIPSATKEPKTKNSEIKDNAEYDVSYGLDTNNVKNEQSERAVKLKSKKSSEEASYYNNTADNSQLTYKGEPFCNANITSVENNAVSVQSDLTEDVNYEPSLPIAVSAGVSEALEYSADGYMLRSVTEPKIRTLTDIEDSLGYRVKIPHYIPDTYAVDSVGVIAGDIVQILYSAPNDEITYRTEKNTNEEEKDISGNFEEYEHIEEEIVNDSTVTIKSNGDEYYNAVWNDESAYSVDSINGIEKDDMLKIIESVDYSDNKEAENTELEEKIFSPCD